MRKPSEISPDRGLFDRFADRATRVISQATFFVFCLAMVILWIPTLFLLDLNTSQLIINTATTIITFLMVALLENSTRRSDQAIQRKLNAIAEGMADILEEFHGTEADVTELRAAVGLEERESTGKA